MFQIISYSDFKPRSQQCYPNVLKYLGHLKIINFPFVPNGKIIILRCSKIRANYSLIIMCSIIGTPNNHHFPFGTNGIVVVLGVPILKHFREIQILC